MAAFDRHRRTLLALLGAAAASLSTASASTGPLPPGFEPPAQATSRIIAGATFQSGSLVTGGPVIYRGRGGPQDEGTRELPSVGMVVQAPEGWHLDALVLEGGAEEGAGLVDVLVDRAVIGEGLVLPESRADTLRVSLVEHTGEGSHRIEVRVSPEAGSVVLRSLKFIAEEGDPEERDPVTVPSDAFLSEDLMPLNKGLTWAYEEEGGEEDFRVLRRLTATDVDLRGQTLARIEDLGTDDYQLISAQGGRSLVVSKLGLPRALDLGDEPAWMLVGPWVLPGDLYEFWTSVPFTNGMRARWQTRVVEREDGGVSLRMRTRSQVPATFATDLHLELVPELGVVREKGLRFGAEFDLTLDEEYEPEKPPPPPPPKPKPRPKPPPPPKNPLRDPKVMRLIDLWLSLNGRDPYGRIRRLPRLRVTMNGPPELKPGQTRHEFVWTVCLKGTDLRSFVERGLRGEPVGAPPSHGGGSVED